MNIKDETEKRIKTLRHSIKGIKDSGMEVSQELRNDLMYYNGVLKKLAKLQDYDLNYLMERII